MQTLSIFAAASTTNPVRDVCRLFENSHNVRVVTSFASSSILAKQIENGAPADIYISANRAWMSYLEDRRVISPSSRFVLATNRLALIYPSDHPVRNIKIDSGMDFDHLLGDGLLAMGDPDHVPAGIYGKEALITLGLWNALKTRIARGKDVRSALMLVARGETPLGVVYTTDAAISTQVRIAGIFPENTHSPIVYEAATIKDTDIAKAFFIFLKSEKSQEIFLKYGFGIK